MKKLLLLFVLVSTIAFSVDAQDYKKFRVGLGLGYASPSGDGAKGGVLLYLEPGYRINDDILLNLRLESAIMARGVEGADESASFSVSSSGSYTLNGQYYFTKNNFRPFVGLGFGMYSIVAASVDVGGQNVALGQDEGKFGFYPRVGFDAGHFHMTIDYNLIGKSTADIGFGETIEQKNSYLGLRLGFHIGGGRNK